VSTKINQLDLFSGIGGFHLGFERAGFEVTSYFSEIDKHAVAVYQHQFKNATYVGSVTDVRGADLPNIDLITFGSPCQDFSLAGKRKGMDGERSSLILEAIRLITECRPRAFVWENVKGTFSSNDGEDFAAILQEFANIGGYRLEWQLLNTSWFLPQNRERIYLVGYSTTPRGDWGGVFPIGEEPREDNGIPRQQGNTCTLTTRYGADGNGSYITKRKQYAQETLTITDKRGNEREATKASTLVAGYYKLPSDADYIKVKSATKQGYEEATEGDSINLSNPDSKTRRGRVGKGRAQTLDTGANQGVVQPVQIGQSTKTFAHKSGTLVGKEGQDAFTIRSSNPNGVAVVQPVSMKWERTEEGKRKRKENRDKEGKDYTSFQDRKLTPSDKPISNTITSFVEKDAMIHDTYRIRRLTPIECERLQGFPDNHTEYGVYDGEVKKMSNTQRYKQCGNAVTVDVVKAVAEQLIPIYNA
jgi:DNA (cytosine-5)-methyltransferase 1